MSTVVVLDKHSGKTTISLASNHRCAHADDATVIFEGRVYLPQWAVSGAEALAKRLQQEGSVKAAEAFLREADGDFAFVIAEHGQLVAARDAIGVQPLYYGENADAAALATRKKALWALGIAEAKSFPPGHCAFASSSGFKFKSVKALVYSAPKQVMMSEAAVSLKHLLWEEVHKRVSSLSKVAVAFSGGLDSSVVAFLASKCHVQVTLIHVSLENQTETLEAQKAAQALGLPLQVHLFGESDVEEAAAAVTALVEEADPVKVSIGIPFYWAASEAAAAGFKVLLAGQGADELFGGYQRYVQAYLAYGEEKAQQMMFNDVAGLHESNLERDMKICSFHGIELRLPFASYELAEFAIALPIELKFERKADSLRKLVLRRAAENMGLPISVTTKPKKAVQYSTGVNAALKKIARKQNMTVSEYARKLFTGK
ncbi:MAG: asparagine synthetase B [Candidatus Bathyarchaeota archaeon]|nr:asparagine synthetase B [Candidatus Bathyarchaeota archaeon]